MNLKLFLTRLWRRIKHLPCFVKESATWECKTCDECAVAYKLIWSVSDRAWNEVVGDNNGKLCVSCFINRANEKNIDIVKASFVIQVFNPNR